MKWHVAVLMLVVSQADAAPPTDSAFRPRAGGLVAPTPTTGVRQLVVPATSRAVPALRDLSNVVPTSPFDMSSDPFGSPTNVTGTTPTTNSVATTIKAVDGATESVKASLGRLHQLLSRKQTKIDPKGWKSVVDGAYQLDNKADSLISVRAEFNSAMVALLRDSGVVQASLTKVTGIFSQLAADSEGDLSPGDGAPLPEPLRRVVGREVSAYRSGAETAKKAADHLVRMVAEQREKAAVIDRSGKTLHRVKTAATAYRELGEAGLALEDAESSLASFGEQLNLVINMLEGMGNEVTSAIQGMNSITKGAK